MKKKKIIILIIILLLVIAGGATAVYFVSKHRREASLGMVYVSSVSDITGGFFTGDSRYMGVVESQEVKGVTKDADKTVKEVYVEVEDEVKTGDVLFEYDTEEMELKLRQMELELESINNNINTMNQQIASLTDEKAQAPEEDKLNYTAQIQNLQAQINQANYDANAKQLEIDRQKLSMQNASVVAPMDGVIKSINENSSSSGDTGYEESTEESVENAYITIMAKGDYRVKASASEFTVRSLTEGQGMIVRSRVDNTSWSGTITKIDLEHPDSGNSDYYYQSGDGASKYPFYIDLDDTEGLMLGQHVYVEVDYGQGTTKPGLWLDEFYIIKEEEKAFVWAESPDGVIEKRYVELGEYDVDMMQYEILSGLTTSDYIAYPEDRVKEGMKATHNYEDVIVDESYDDSGEENMDEYYDGAMDDMIEDNLEDGTIYEEDTSGSDTFDVDGQVEEIGGEEVVPFDEYYESDEGVEQ